MTGFPRDKKWQDFTQPPPGPMVELTRTEQEQDIWRAAYGASPFLPPFSTPQNASSKPLAMGDATLFVWITGRDGSYRNCRGNYQSPYTATLPASKYDYWWHGKTAQYSHVCYEDISKHNNHCFMVYGSTEDTGWHHGIRNHMEKSHVCHYTMD